VSGRREARRAVVDDEGRDALLLVADRAGARQNNAEPSHRALRDERLRAVQNPHILVTPGGRSQSSRIAPAARLRERPRRKPLAAGGFR
jgi:hypothetical protein